MQGKHLITIFLLASMNHSFASDPVEILRCTSENRILSIYKNKKNYSVSLVSPITRERIEQRFQGMNLGEEEIKLFLAKKQANEIPLDYQTYQSFELSHETVKNGFKMSGKNIGLDLIKNDNDEVKVHFSFQKMTSSQIEKRSGTMPLGPLSAIDCQILKSAE